jgi:hypothetical protein
MNILELRVKLGVFKEMNIIGGTALQFTIEEKFKTIVDQLEKAEKEESIEKVDSIPYLDLLADMTQAFLALPINDELCTYFNFLTEVLFNWNANCACDKKIEAFSLMLNRLIEVRSKMKVSTDMMKDVYERYIDLANWQPPIFDLAVEYFDKLLDDNEKKIIEQGTKTKCDESE